MDRCVDCGGDANDEQDCPGRALIAYRVDVKCVDCGAEAHYVLAAGRSWEISECAECGSQRIEAHMVLVYAQDLKAGAS